jgi:site-specific recombinase XerD
MADTGASVHDVQSQLGHGSLATTDRYVHELRPMALIEHMRTRDWSPA